MKIQTTTNYGQFNFLLANRSINESKVKNLAHEIAVNGLKVPIIVNERLEVIDGQHRLQACKQVKEPLKYFVSRGATVADAAAANQAGSNWNKRDWIDYHAARGNQDYLKLQTWIAHCKSMGVISLDAAILFAQNNATTKTLYKKDGQIIDKKVAGSVLLGNQLKVGTWQFGDEKTAFQLLEMYCELSETAAWTNKKLFITTMIRVSRISDFNLKWLLKQIKKYPQKWYNCVNGDAYIAMIEDIYNYNRNRSNRLPIKHNPELSGR
jgi:hypothetical protein